ncbi:Centrin-1 [Tyrophagus putrescentiae]|nr:Centrin-1 [Tyrophagus putrescentiae]
MNFDDDDDDVWTPSNDSGSEASTSGARAKKTMPKKPSVARNSKGRHSSSSSATMSSVNAEFLDDIKATFERFDVEKAGKLETKQLKFAMRSLGFEPKKEEIKRISEEYDKDGYISSADFISLMTKRMTEKTVNEEIMKAFQLFDDSHRGKITFDDLKRVSTELGEKISDDELLEMIEEADVDGDHAVNCQEFLRIMKKTSLY